MWSERTRCSARPVSFSSAVRSSAANTISSSDCCRVLVVVCEATRDFLKKTVVQVDEQAKDDAKSCGAERCWCLFVWVPDEGSQALRDLVRAREAAKQDQTRARHRLSKFLLRSGQRPPTRVRPWTRPYLIWVAQLRFTQIAQESTHQDYLHEVEHMRERVARLEQAIMEVVKLASPALEQVINDLEALRGIADISAVTIASELGQVSRFDSARQLMGLLRRCTKRGFQWRANETRRHHQDR